MRYVRCLFGRNVYEVKQKGSQGEGRKESWVNEISDFTKFWECFFQAKKESCKSKWKHPHASQEWVWTWVPGKLSHQLSAAGGDCGFSTDRGRSRRETAEASAICFLLGFLWAGLGTGIASPQLQTEAGLKAQPRSKGMVVGRHTELEKQFVAFFNPLSFPGAELTGQASCCSSKPLPFMILSYVAWKWDLHEI